MFQKFLKLFKNPKSTQVKIGENTYTWPSDCDGYKGGTNTGPVSERPPKPELSQDYVEKLDKENKPRYFEGCGWYLPAQEGSTLKGGANEVPSTDRPSPPTLTHKEKTSPPSEDNSITEAKIPLSPELVKTITEVIEENYEKKWKDGYPLGEIENLYKEFQLYVQIFRRSPPWGPCLTTKMEDFLNELDWGIRQLCGEPVTISYKEYKALKNLLSELYKSTAVLYMCRSPLKPYSEPDMIEQVCEHLMTEWGEKTTNKK